MADTFRNIRDDSGGGGAVTSVNSQTGAVVLTKADLSLNNVDNTSDANKPVSAPQQAALDLKLDLISNPVINPDGNTGGFSHVSLVPDIKPLQNSPNETQNLFLFTANIDPDSSGYTMGTSGTFGSFFTLGFNHQGTSDIGNASYFNTSSSFGNGTDPISIKGFQEFLGFGTISNNVTIEDSLQGFGMQLTMASGATLNGYVNAFYDNNTINCTSGPYTSFSANPSLAEVRNNNNYTAVNVNPTVTKLTGNSSVNGFAFSGNYGSGGIGTGGINGVSINPTITNNNSYNGIYSSSQNVTGGTKWAGYFDGDVNITGSLTFGGALSIGQLTAFGTLNPVVDGGGTPTTVNSLISSITIPASSTTNNADTIGLNTASLVNVGAGSTTNMSGIRIFSSLALPSVIETHTGSYLSDIQGGVFALSLSGTSTGGTIDTAAVARFVSVPNGITTINRHYGAWMHLPFGSVATDEWGIYNEDAAHNYFEGDLKIGGSDIADASAAIEIESTTQGFLNARMTTTERDAITAVNGLQIYNTTTNKLQVYAGGVWVDLH